MLVVELKRKRKLKLTNTGNWNGKKQWKTKLKLKNISQLKSPAWLSVNHWCNQLLSQSWVVQPADGINLMPMSMTVSRMLSVTGFNVSHNDDWWHLHNYITNDLCSGQPVPPRSDAHFWPSNRCILGIMSKTWYCSVVVVEVAKDLSDHNPRKQKHNIFEAFSRRKKFHNLFQSLSGHSTDSRVENQLEILCRRGGSLFHV